MIQNIVFFSKKYQCYAIHLPLVSNAQWALTVRGGGGQKEASQKQNTSLVVDQLAHGGKTVNYDRNTVSVGLLLRFCCVR